MNANFGRRTQTGARWTGKDRVTIYLFKSAIALGAEKAKRRNETLPSYIARNFERVGARNSAHGR